MKIAILGSRGIPNRYGGFEQLSEHLAAGLASSGEEVVVYCPHDHPDKSDAWKGAKQIRRYNPEPWLGQAGQFIYDLLCILDCRNKDYDVILQLGYTTSAIWFHLHPSGSIIITNTDGLEWKRSKYPALIRRFLKWSEHLAVHGSDALVSDSQVIRSYIRETYGIYSRFIAYGATPGGASNPEALEKYNLNRSGYFLLIARFQQDNNLEMVIRGWLGSGSPFPLVIIGDHHNAYGRRLKRRYSHPGLRFAGAVYDQETLRCLRSNCRLYFHGHSGGGTNPSLLEAMADGALICAHDNAFNREVLSGNAHFFSSAEDISGIISAETDPELRSSWIDSNILRISTDYSWPDIITAYQALFTELTNTKG